MQYATDWSMGGGGNLHPVMRTCLNDGASLQLAHPRSVGEGAIIVYLEHAAKPEHFVLHHLECLRQVPALEDKRTWRAAEGLHHTTNCPKGADGVRAIGEVKSKPSCVCGIVCVQREVWCGDVSRPQILIRLRVDKPSIAVDRNRTQATRAGIVDGQHE